jgi:Tfp pilus assembly protein PilN
MLRTNLSTRPFYNTRAVQVLLGIIALVVVALTAFNAVQILRLTTSQRTLGERASRAEAESAELRTAAARLRAQINPEELRTVAAAASEANGIIDRRAFSWTELLARFEQTLPDDVRITAIQPRHDNGRVIISAIVEARQIEELDSFIEALERTGTFRDVLPAEYQQDENGTYQAVIEGVYIAASAGAEVAPPADGAARDEGPGE